MGRSEDPCAGVHGPGAEASAEAAFDRYLALLGEGRAPPPEEFLRACGTQAPALRAALERLWQRAGPAPSPAGEGQHLGAFRLVRQLGAGGMGVVWLAEQEGLGRAVALKLLRPELLLSGLAAERFRREARTLARLRHPNIVTLLEAGSAAGVSYLVMEHVEGTSLAELAASGELARLPVARRVRWFVGLARALQYAHAQGVVHRDVKPSNVLVARAGPGSEERALLLDFGLARVADSEAVSLTDAFAGSPSYASPEQISGAALDGRSDVYSLGVTLYRTLAPRPAFAGNTVEALFRAILAGEYVPLERAAPDLPRDLVTVVQRAMERDPAQRYPDAGALADDLEAVLELRAIRGQRPGWWSRARRAARRRPALAAALTTAVLALAAGGTGWLLRERARGAERRAEARAAVDEARAAIARYRERRNSATEVQLRLADLAREEASQYLTRADYALIDRHERELTEAAQAFELAFHEVLDLLRHAERLDPEVVGSEEVRGELFLERHRHAYETGDRASADFYAERAARVDPEGAAAVLRQDVALTFASEPTGAAIHLFRLEEATRLEPAGEPRRVAVPHGPARAPVRPDHWCLVVRADQGTLRRGDLVLELAGHPIEGSRLVARAGGPAPFAARLVAVDGAPLEDPWGFEDEPASAPRRYRFEHEGAPLELAGSSLAALGLELATPPELVARAERPPLPARVFRDGEVLALELPPALDVRATARPLITLPANELGRTPFGPVTLPSGTYLALARLDGHEEQRSAFVLARGGAHIAFELRELGATPSGFVHIAGSDGGFWIQEREVTSREYLEFLDDTATLDEIEARGERVRVPRQGSGPNVRTFWERAADGSYRLPAGWGADWPVVGLSFDDAQAYARWYDARARARGDTRAYRLPTRDEFLRAALGSTKWSYVYGERFRARWSRCCFSRPSARPGPVLGFPVDESVFGVFDLTGGALEWLATPYDEGRALRHLVGGGWGQGGPETNKAAGGIGVDGETCTGETGLRLVALRAGAAR